MPTYTLDPLHPDRLRCGQCGKRFGPAFGPDPGASLTADQAAALWPELAKEVREHEERHKEGRVARAVHGATRGRGRPSIDDEGYDRDVWRRLLRAIGGAFLTAFLALWVNSWGDGVHWWAVGICGSLGFLLGWFLGAAAIEFLLWLFRWV